MVLRFYNSLSREVEDFTPVHPGEARFYACGPTVYNHAHIGNFRSYVFSDLLRRYLKFKGYRVTEAMNVTDVDDKTIRDSRAAGVPLAEFTERYAKAFFEDLAALNIEPAEHYPRATEHVPEMLALIQALLDKGAAYKGEDGSVYFDISRYSKYGQLADLSGIQQGASGRVDADEYSKEEARDFVLWKAWDASDGPVGWESQFGRGRPGWHIECSAMSARYLGAPFDLHTGGVDLRFPHHENEIAQSEAATGKKFANYWLHCEHLVIDGRKMAKSAGNFYTLRDVLARGFEARAVRWLLLSTHYRSQLNFTFPALEQSANTLHKLDEFVQRIQEKQADGKENATLAAALAAAEKGFEEGLDNDLNASLALPHLFELARVVNAELDARRADPESLARVLAFLKRADSVLGVLEFDKQEFPAEALALVKEREEARKARDYARSDVIRKKLEETGFTVQDTPQGPKLGKLHRKTLVEDVKLTDSVDSAKR
ncbi:MAG: cysteine--tRNA ligase [Candidatus Micrarchaeia archaeon]